MTEESAELQPVPTEADAPRHALAVLVESDARRLATLISQGGGSREVRKRARGALNRAFAADPTLDALGWVEVLQGLAEALRELGDGALDATLPVGQVWVRKPMPERLMRPRVAWRLTAQGTAIYDRCNPRLALSEARIEWFEVRCNVQSPGRLRPVRPSEAKREPLSGSEFEFLHKRGKSPFS